MADVHELTMAFVSAHPADAARVLEGLPVAESAAFIAALAPKPAATVVRQLAPAYAGRCFGNLDDGQVGDLVVALGPQSAAARVQHLPVERQVKILERLPVGNAVAIRLLIGYPRDTAGACMDPWPLALPPDTAAAEALDQVRDFDGDPVQCVFVVSPERSLLGVAPVSEILRAAPRASLSRIMHGQPHSVPALAAVGPLRQHPGWDEYPVLPVVEREDRLVGALSRRAVTASLARGLAYGPGDGTADMLATVAGLYWLGVARLVHLAVGLLPPSTPARKERHDR